VGVAAKPCHRPSPAGGWWAPGYPARRRRLTVRTAPVTWPALEVGAAGGRDHDR
jgi:hypothetical protein